MGTVEMHQRPDIWIGKTVLLVEDQKLAYVVGTVNEYNKSSKAPHSTQLSLSYIHHPSTIIGVPWFEATNKGTNYTLPSDIEKTLL
jgi:hypothetical protein